MTLGLIFFLLLSFKIQYKIKTIQDLVSLKESDRHNLLHFLEDEKYEEVMAVLGSFPYVTMDIKSQGKWEVSMLNIVDLLIDWLLFIWFKVLKTFDIIMCN